MTWLIVCAIAGAVGGFVMQAAWLVCAHGAYTFVCSQKTENESCGTFISTKTLVELNQLKTTHELIHHK